MIEGLRTWHALHDQCPPDGCGSCSTVDLEWTDEEMAEIVSAAARLGLEVDEYVHLTIKLGMEAEGAGS